MTSEMQERIARAIWNIRREEEDRCDMELEDMGRRHPVWTEALAVMKAMREPTPVMTETGVAAAQGCGIEDFNATDFRLIFCPALDAEISLAEGGSDDRD